MVSFPPSIYVRASHLESTLSTSVPSGADHGAGWGSAAGPPHRNQTVGGDSPRAESEGMHHSMLSPNASVKQKGPEL